jgi:ABC-type uncharacterized transport system fused permease/ATPase subunit
MVSGKFKKPLLSYGKRDYLFDLFTIAWPKAGGRGLLELRLMWLISLLRTGIIFATVRYQRSLNRALFSTDHAAFWQALKHSVGIIALSASVNGLKDWASRRFSLHVRQVLTEHIQGMYMRNNIFYHLGNLPNEKSIPDVEERICSETWILAQKIGDMVDMFITSTPVLLVFTGQLIATRGVKFALLPHFYLLCAYEVAQKLFPKNISKLKKDEAQRQAALRKHAGYVQRNAEAIAALEGHDRESSELLKSKLNPILAISGQVNKAMFRFGITYQLAYTYGFRPWMSLFGLNTILRSELATGNGVMVTYREMMSQLYEMLVALGNFLTLHATSLHYQGLSKRVLELGERIHEIQTKDPASVLPADRIEFDDVHVVTPTGRLLVEHLSFSVPRGGSLLVTGANGAGKSSIFRCLGGLWTIEHGRIYKPGGTGNVDVSDVFYMPQKPYCVVGTISEQIAYPRSADLRGEELRSLLERVGLSFLAAREGEVVQWDEQLSLGEKQRLAMARLFFHVPKFAVLDECTSGVSASMEAYFYSELSRLGITYITICHRPVLKAYHQQNLHLIGDGTAKYTLSDIPVMPPPRGVHCRQLAVPPAVPEMRSRRSTRNLIARVAKLAAMMMSGTYTNLGGLFALLLLRTCFYEAGMRSLSNMIQATVDRRRERILVWFAAALTVDWGTAWLDETVNWLSRHLAIAWHRKLTERFVSCWMKHRQFYDLRHVSGRIPDADQRVTAEIKEFCNQFSAVFQKVLTPLCDLFWFSGRIWVALGPLGLGALGGYNALAWMILRLAMPRHGILLAKEKQLESNFRFSQTRLRQQAESIAFLGGGDIEAAGIERSFGELVSHQRMYRARKAVYAFVVSAVSKDLKSQSKAMQLPMLLSYWAQRRLCSMSTEGLVGRTAYLDSAIVKAVDAFANTFAIAEELRKLLGSAARVDELWEAMDENGPPSKDESSSTDSAEVVFESVPLVTPTNQTLATNISIKLRARESLLVTGPNSVGKTSLFRVLAGLWPHAGGRIKAGRLGKVVMLVPQRCFCPPGKLSELVTYPLTSGSDDAIRDALAKVGLSQLAETWELTAVQQWEDILSLGEQQRIGIARLFFHKPPRGVLDECTSAVSMEVEVNLYKSLIDSGIACITMSQRLALPEFHEFELELGADTEDGYEFRPTSRGSGGN